MRRDGVDEETALGERNGPDRTDTIVQSVHPTEDDAEKVIF